MRGWSDRREPDDLPEVHHTLSAEWGEHLVVERGADADVGTLDRHMIEHGCIMAPRRLLGRAIRHSAVPGVYHCRRGAGANRGSLATVPW